MTWSGSFKLSKAETHHLKLTEVSLSDIEHTTHISEWTLETSVGRLYSSLENPMDGGAWWAVVHEVTKSRTRLSNFTFTFYFHALEKEMATHSSVLAWRIPGTGEPGGLPSMGSHRVRHDWSDLAAAAAAAAGWTEMLWMWNTHWVSTI